MSDVEELAMLLDGRYRTMPFVDRVLPIGTVVDERIQRLVENGILEVRKEAARIARIAGYEQQTACPLGSHCPCGRGGW